MTGKRLGFVVLVVSLVSSSEISAQAPILPDVPLDTPSTIFIDRLKIDIENGILVEDVESLPRLTDSVIASCIADPQEQEVVSAFVGQLEDADPTDCAANAYFTQRSLRTYLRNLGLKQPPTRDGCEVFDDAISTEFALKEYDASRHGACTYSLPLQKCEVSTRGGRLRFRSFPHIGNRPITDENLVTVLDFLDHGTTNVVVQSAYEGWAFVVADRPSNNGQRSIGWVSFSYLSNCR